MCRFKPNRQRHCVAVHETFGFFSEKQPTPFSQAGFRFHAQSGWPSHTRRIHSRCRAELRIPTLFAATPPPLGPPSSRHAVGVAVSQADSKRQRQPSGRDPWDHPNCGSAPKSPMPHKNTLLTTQGGLRNKTYIQFIRARRNISRLDRTASAKVNLLLPRCRSVNVIGISSIFEPCL